ncbi:MAG: hypothetical protein AAF429_08750 [Pseudomonadota bacterium]
MTSIRAIQKSVFYPCAVVFLSSQFGLAQPIVLTCELDSPGNWMPEKFTVKYDVETRKVDLLDPNPEEFAVKPGKIVRAKSDIVVLRLYRIGVTNSSHQRANFQYSIRYNPVEKTVLGIAQPLGYNNRFRSNGTCSES